MPWASQRTIPVLLASATLIPIIALGWLGVRVLQQDHALERQQERERLEVAAGRVALAIEQHLRDIEERVSKGAGLLVTALGIESGQTGPGILYQPAVASVADVPEATFREAEQLEFSASGLQGAATAYRKLVESAQPAVKAAALVRLGRVLRKSGDHAGALDAYRRLLNVAAPPISGQPVELVARQGLCRTYEEMRDSDGLREQVSELSRVLYSGSLRMDRATFDLYRDMTVRWGGQLPPRDAVSRTESVISLWRSWRGGELASRGRRILHEGGEPVLALWAGDTAHIVVSLISARELEAALTPRWRDQRLTVWLQDALGQPFFGARVAGGVILTAAESRSPFVVGVASQSSRDGYGMSRTILIGGLLLTFAFTLAAAYGLYRATMREMALARQQADFISAVSHEFRTPLTSMRHLTEMLVSRGALDEQRKSYYYELLASETERLHRMVESLLSFGRIEAGAYAWRLEPADTRELVNGLVSEFRNDPLVREREILCEIDDGLPSILADREALSRAFWNLLENAVKYSEPGSPIRVFARRDAESIIVGVEDHGNGIPQGEQSKIFQKFVRGSEASRAGIRGVGIGLALVKRIAEAHGGSVQLSSEPGRGSTFTLVLPCHAS